MKRQLHHILARYGQSVQIRVGEETIQTRAFFQPLKEKSEQVPGEVTSLGWLDTRMWLYLGQEQVSEGDTVTWEGTDFTVCTSRPYFIGNEVHHWWAVLKAAKEET